LNRIEDILAKYDVDPGSVEIEVTESVMVQSVEALRQCMDRLHEMGFRVAIDDFGTGYSSLSVLGDIPADVIKIDKSFLDNHMSNQKLSLLYEIGRMVRLMKKDIIIEGVENEEQEKVLLEGGFTCAQGYLCNKPIPQSQFEDLYL
jgi:EAL domain-containing protein (putative c-di-GMP-specific phosphodiesterase class I)